MCVKSRVSDAPYSDTPPHRRTDVTHMSSLFNKSDSQLNSVAQHQQLMMQSLPAFRGSSRAMMLPTEPGQGMVHNSCSFVAAVVAIAVVVRLVKTWSTVTLPVSH